jgi:hypothetical protein
VKLIASGESIRIKFVLVLEYAPGQFAREPNIQPSRFVRHDVNPIGFHAFARDCTRLESSGADSSGLTEVVTMIMRRRCSALGTAGRWGGVVFGL